MYLNICENSNFLSVISFVKEIINIISVIVPIGLIVMISIDIFKMVVSSEESAFSLNTKKIIFRLIAATAVFFVPSFVNLLLTLLNERSYNTGSCWINANSEKIAYFKAIEEADRQVQEEKIAEEKRNAADERKALEELREQARLEQENSNNNSSGNNSGNSSSTNSEVFSSTKYSLTELQLIGLARLCYAEQGSVSGAAAEASLMANLFEKDSKKNYGEGGNGLYNYVRTSSWFANAAKHMDTGTYTPEILWAVKNVLVNGNRTMPSNVVEHDCWFCNKRSSCSMNSNKGDICKIEVNGRVLTSEADIKNRNNYIKDKTVIYNVYGSIYKFYMFPSERSDPFGYIIGYYNP